MFRDPIPTGIGGTHFGEKSRNYLSGGELNAAFWPRNGLETSAIREVGEKRGSLRPTFAPTTVVEDQTMLLSLLTTTARKYKTESRNRRNYVACFTRNRTKMLCFV